MKTDTKEYTDGTEPDVYRRWCCDGMCKQGRLCPKRMPAEASTEVGHEEPNFYSSEMMLEEFAKLVIGSILILLCVGVVALLVGYFT